MGREHCGLWLAGPARLDRGRQGEQGRQEPDWGYLGQPWPDIGRGFDRGHGHGTRDLGT